MRARIPIFLLATTLGAQTAAPVKVPFACPQEELTAAGMSCSDDNPCPVYLELSSVSAFGKKLLVTGNLHGPSSTIDSVLLLSDDGGLTWKETAGRVMSAALDQVQLLDATHGWAAGEIQIPLSRDPFLLITNDGGVTWRQKDVTEEGGPGEVMRFWFDNPEHGELIVDGGRSAPGGRYQMYESNSSGDSWNIVSKSAQLPRLRRTPGLVAPDYRIGTDSKTKSHVVERRDGARWSLVASFPVQAASCGSPPPPPAPPTPPEESPIQLPPPEAPANAK